MYYWGILITYKATGRGLDHSELCDITFESMQTAENWARDEILNQWTVVEVMPVKVIDVRNSPVITTLDGQYWVKHGEWK